MGDDRARTSASGEREEHGPVQPGHRVQQACGKFR